MRAKWGKLVKISNNLLQRITFYLYYYDVSQNIEIPSMHVSIISDFRNVAIVYVTNVGLPAVSEI